MAIGFGALVELAEVDATSEEEAETLRVAVSEAVALTDTVSDASVVGAEAVPVAAEEAETQLDHQEEAVEALCVADSTAVSVDSDWL